MLYLAAFFAGAFLMNAIPHLAAGLQGSSFPTPFSKPRGIGNSSPLLNVWWGAFNLAVGGYLLGLSFDIENRAAAWLVIAAGALALGTYLALHFGKTRGAA